MFESQIENTYALPRQIVMTAHKAPMLEKEREVELARRWREERDENAIKELTLSHLRLTISIARKFKHYGLPMADLVQEGTIGLMEAADRFEIERDIRFSTYANWWVRASIQDYVLRNWSIVRTGTTAAHKSLFFNFKRVRAKIAGLSDNPLSETDREAVAAQLNVRVKDVEVMEARLSGRDNSLNARISEDQTSIEAQDQLVDERLQPDESVIEQRTSSVRSQLLERAMDRLDDREKAVISARRLTDDGITLAALGKRMGISKERVRQIENQALEKMKHAIIAAAGDHGRLDCTTLF